ncbi:unnamed protein product [Closterium sp. NIES-53]
MSIQDPRLGMNEPLWGQSMSNPLSAASSLPVLPAPAEPANAAAAAAAAADDPAIAAAAPRRVTVMGVSFMGGAPGSAMFGMFTAGLGPRNAVSVIAAVVSVVVAVAGTIADRIVS